MPVCEVDHVVRKWSRCLSKVVEIERYDCAMSLSLQDVGLAVKRLQWRHHSTANKQLATIGLSLAQWDVLRHLHDNPEASLHALAVLTFQTDQSMGALAGRMVEHGVLERMETPGRAVQHRLTTSGEDLRVRGSVLLDGVMQATIGRLTTTERTTLHALLIKAAG